MNRRRRPRWLLFPLLGFLAALCITAPREWREIDRSKPHSTGPDTGAQPADACSAVRNDVICAVQPDEIEPACVEANVATLVIDEQDLAPTATNGAAIDLSNCDDATHCAAPEAASRAVGQEQWADATQSISEPAGALAGGQPDVNGSQAPTDCAQNTTSGNDDPNAASECKLAKISGDPDDSRPTATLAARPAPPAATLDARELDSVDAEPTEAEFGPEAESGPTAGWHDPADLRERLAALAEQKTYEKWARGALGLIDQLAGAGGPRGDGAVPILASLNESIAEIDRLLIGNENDGSNEAVQRAKCALQRRIALWQHLVELPSPDRVRASAQAPQPERLLACLSQLDELTNSSSEGAGWRRYLLIDQLRELADDRQQAQEKMQSIARQVLRRLLNQKLSETQQRFATSHPLLALRSELRSWAAEPVDLDQMVEQIELYEQSGKASSGELVASYRQQLAGSALPAVRQLADHLDRYYRGANVRLAISNTLLTRMMPPQDARDEYVREVVLGIPTSGQSHRETELDVRLIPDPSRLRFMIEAKGLVYARTSARATGATVWTGLNSTFQIQKPLEMTLHGLRAAAVEADAQAQTHLRGVETPLSGFPVLGSMLDGFVRKQYRERRRTAERELRKKVIQKAVEEMETQVEQRIANANDRLRQAVLTPLDRLELLPEVAEMQTTADRMTLRLRVAANHQLAAETPRPRAPSDSLASFQIHESVLNNVFNQLDLNGRTFTPATLYGWVVQRMNRPADSVPDNLRDDVYLTFAPSDAFRVRARNGQLEINLSLDELRAEGHTYRNFLVRVYYRPDQDGGRGELVRDGVVQLIGSSITLRGQLALRGIFSKTFPREKRFTLLPQRFLDDKRLANVRVSQMVLTDGWLGMALTEDRLAKAGGAASR